MTDAIDNKFKDFLGDYDELTKLNVLGQFNFFELIEIVFYPKNSKAPENVFSIAVAKQYGPEYSAKKINDERIKAPGNPGSFGIFKSVIKAETFRTKVAEFSASKLWNPNGIPVLTNDLEPIRKRFVPSNGSSKIPLNLVLKNNFYSGSYLLELFDTKKTRFDSLVSEPTSLQQLSDSLISFVPIRLAALADRLGNIIIQFPCESLRAEFRTNGSHFFSEIAWHPKIQSRKVIVSGMVNHDDTLITFGQKISKGKKLKLLHDPGYGVFQGYVWDVKYNLMLFATKGAPIKSMSIGMKMGVHEPRTLPKNIEDNDATERVQLTDPPRRISVGGDDLKKLQSPTQARIYGNELSDLIRSKKFLQYRSIGTVKNSERLRALQDIRALIKSEGEYGVWLWDPYLSAQDLLDSLFYNPTKGASMRALTLLKTHKEGSKKGILLEKSSNKFPIRLKNIKEAFISPKAHKKIKQSKNKPRDELQRKYSKQLKNISGNQLGLNIEYRTAHGAKGANFHDRFLIFPKSINGPAKAWSLGTSINSLGKTHHVLQKVDNPQLIADSFQSHWKASDNDKYLIWKVPQ